MCFKGIPVERQGRKVTGLRAKPMTAELPFTAKVNVFGVPPLQYSRF